ncbi:UNVERIFIED_ORG: hypothetical protein GGI57_001998 [Rhizobium aethiopicum]
MTQKHECANQTKDVEREGSHSVNCYKEIELALGRLHLG